MEGNGSDTEVLFPETELTVGDEKLTIRPFYFGEWPQAFRLAMPIFSALIKAGLVRPEDGKILWGIRAGDDLEKMLGTLFLEVPESVISLVAFAVNKPRKWFNTVRPDDGIDLAKAVFKANSDFFSKRVLPKLPTLETAPSVGERSSPSSSAPDTTGAQSEGTH
jgi:hypothetical protein